MNIINYNPKGFKDFSESDLGKRVWNYLISDDARLRLELTTQLGHPAVEGVGDRLLGQFGDNIKDDRVKQAIGHMVRAIMEHYGYHLEQKGVRCRKKKEVFVFGARYVKN